MSKAALLNQIRFDIAGKLITSNGDIPTYLRPSPAIAEYVINGSLRTILAKSDVPRFGQSGELDLEPEATNFLPYSLNLSHSGWIKGSSVSILSDRIPGMDGNYEAERVTVSAFTGNTNAQRLSRTVVLRSGLNYTGTVYLRLAGGQLGPNDWVGVDGDVISPVQVSLAEIYNERAGNYLAASFQFTTAGTEVNLDVNDDPGRSVNFVFYCESSVSVDWGGAQIELGDVRTSFIPTRDRNIVTRAADFIEYGRSPMATLASFVVYTRLLGWRGSGAIVRSGNFTLELVNGVVQATCGVVTITDPDPLPGAAQIAVRVSKGLESVLLYVNGVLKARETLSGYVGSIAPFQVGGSGVLRLQNLYVFGGDLSDGSAAIGQSVGSSLATLFVEDTIITDQSPGYSELSFPSIYLPPYSDAEIRLPGLQIANQAITNISSSVAAVAQVTRVYVENIVNASAAQTEWVAINNSRYSFTSDATPTRAEIAQGIRDLIVGLYKHEPVTATYTASDEFFSLTADSAGEGFDVLVSDNLSAEVHVANNPGSQIFTVPNAVDYALGEALVYRQGVFLGAVGITSISLIPNQLTIEPIGNQPVGLIEVGDQLIQRNWNLSVGMNGTFAHHFEDHPDVRCSGKERDRFSLRNVGGQSRIVTPYLKVTL